MPSANTTVAELQRGITRATGQRHRLVIEQHIVDRIEVDDVSFHFNSAVLLPAPGGAGAGRDAGALAGLVTIARALSHAAENGGKQLVIAGHTDTVGSQGANHTLSVRRATNVLLYLRGDREGWAKACHHHVPRDIQRLLRWATQQHGFDCDPRSDSGELDAATLTARRKFRSQHRARFGSTLPVSGPQSEADWAAFYDLYEITLATLLRVEVGALSSKRAALKFASSPALACGEHWPIDGHGIDEHRSSLNRRVEILFHDPGSLPDQTATTPPGLDLYGPNPAHRLRTVRLNIPPAIRVLDPEGEPLSNVTVVVEMADGTHEPHTSDQDGVITLPPVPGYRYRVIELAETSSDKGTLASARVGLPLEV